MKRYDPEKGGAQVECEIVELLAARDERGIELIVDQYEKLIRYIAGTILGGRETAVEECVNDVYLCGSTEPGTIMRKLPSEPTLRRSRETRR